MKIAILGATSQIAKDLIISFYKNESGLEVVMFSRSKQRVLNQFKDLGLDIDYKNLTYSDFSDNEHYDVIMNFVGVGDPAQAKRIGPEIFEITERYDNLVLEYLKKRPGTKYIFMSSGAVYGGSFEEPVNEKTRSIVDLNNLDDSDWYSIAKIYAEARHRALRNLSIVDVRIFNYFSQTQDINARFLITDIVRCIVNKELLVTSSQNIYRDFITPDEFYRLIKTIFSKPKINMAVDCYTKAPIDKITLIDIFEEKFGLKYEFAEQAGLNATGVKINYYSKNHMAESIGFFPQFSSLDALTSEMQKVFDNNYGG